MKMSLYRLCVLFSIVSQAFHVYACVCGLSESSVLESCDEFSTRIAGGKFAEVNEFPWAALLEIKAGGNPLRCGGTLVNDRWK